MATATATVTTPALAADGQVTGYGRLGSYLATINPFVNFKRWITAQFVYWGAVSMSVSVLTFALHHSFG